MYRLVPHKRKLHLLSFLLFLCSCSDPCEGLECLSEDRFAFTIKSVSSGEDLLFRSSPQISQDDVEVFYVLNGNRELVQVQFQSQYAVVVLYDDVEEYYVHALGKTDMLSLQISRRSASECCPSTTDVEMISLNGEEVGRDSWVIDLFR